MREKRNEETAYMVGKKVKKRDETLELARIMQC